MVQHFARMAALVAAFGFLYSCTTVNHLQQAERLSENQRHAAAYESAVRAVESEPGNPDAHLLRAETGINLARERQPSDRIAIYEDVAASLNASIELAAGSPNEDSVQQRVVQIRNKAYNYEYESALTYTSGEGSRVNPYSMVPAIPHLQNALVIHPQQKSIYETLTNVFASNYFYDEAAETLEKQYQNIGLNKQELELAGFMHYQAENFESAIFRLQQAWDNGRGTTNAGRGLANAYRKTGDTMSEREILEQLTEIEPDNIYNHLAYGKNLMEEVFSTLEQIDGQLDDASMEQLAFSLEEIERIESVFEQALQLDENHILANISAGLFYRNTAFSLKRIEQILPGSNPEGITIPDTNDLLYKSLNNLELASERDPNQPLVWNALWRVYEALGMQRQAQEARSKAQD